MRQTRTFLSLLFYASCAIAGWSQQNAYFTNPVIHGDVPDPSILRIGETYYATGTSSEWAPHYPIFTSTDLVNWRQIGHIFDQKPDWTLSSFWAPEWFHHDGRTYVYYTARKRSDNISCIGVAVADSPIGKFKDYGPVVEFGKEAIDAFVLEDKGELYISWKAYGLDNRPIELLACQLSDDGLRLEGEPFHLLRDDDRVGMEGQHWFKHGDYYYLIYSEGGCCGPRSDYAVSVARSKNIDGPYEKYAGNPILHGSKEVLSIGHGTIATAPDGRMYYLCHAYLPGNGFYQGRQPFLQEIRMGDDGWPHFVTGEYAVRTQPVPFAETAQRPLADFYDDFSADRLRNDWSWNYTFADIQASVRNGRLTLAGMPKQGVSSGTALCLRPAAEHYTFETAVVNQNDAWKGIALYGDARNLITLGCAGDRLMLKCLMDGKERMLADLPLPASPLYLRMEVEEGTCVSFAWSRDGECWSALSTDALSADEARALVQWDRVSRPGLYHEGKTAAPAVYMYARLINH